MITCTTLSDRLNYRHPRIGRSCTCHLPNFCYIEWNITAVIICLYFPLHQISVCFHLVVINKSQVWHAGTMCFYVAYHAPWTSVLSQRLFYCLIPIGIKGSPRKPVWAACPQGWAKRSPNIFKIHYLTTRNRNYLQFTRYSVNTTFMVIYSLVLSTTLTAGGVAYSPLHTRGSDMLEDFARSH